MLIAKWHVSYLLWSWILLSKIYMNEKQKNLFVLLCFSKNYLLHQKCREHFCSLLGFFFFPPETLTLPGHLVICDLLKSSLQLLEEWVVLNLFQWDGLWSPLHPIILKSNSHNVLLGGSWNFLGNVARECRYLYIKGYAQITHQSWFHPWEKWTPRVSGI